jgi:hypothetical protein
MFSMFLALKQIYHNPGILFFLTSHQAFVDAIKDDDLRYLYILPALRHQTII